MAAKKHKRHKMYSFFNLGIFRDGSLPPHLRGSSLHLREGSPHLQESSPHLREVPPHLRESSLHLREDSPHLREGSLHLQESFPHLREGSPHLRETFPHQNIDSIDWSWKYKYNKAAPHDDESSP